MARGTRTVYPGKRNKGLSSSFQPLEEGRSVQWPKRCDKHGDKNEDNIPKNVICVCERGRKRDVYVSMFLCACYKVLLWKIVSIFKKIITVFVQRTLKKKKKLGIKWIFYEIRIANKDDIKSDKNNFICYNKNTYFRLRNFIKIKRERHKNELIIIYSDGEILFIISCLTGFKELIQWLSTHQIDIEN